ncbi:MAG: class I SAM-dependent methyltransferase, partial [Ignavibacteria bacterium]
MNTLNEYYSYRAKEYEDIYYRNDPARQKEQNEIHNELRSIFKNKSVLEVACGTGYWTKTISEVASNILAIDYSRDVIDIAKSKNLSADFLIDDAYKMQKVGNGFNAGCANFWVSHVPKTRISEFLNTFYDKLAKDSYVFMSDNIFMKGIGGDLIQKEG